MKECFFCGEYENPYKGHRDWEATEENPENFQTIGIIAPYNPNKPDVLCFEGELGYVHIECQLNEKYG